MWDRLKRWIWGEPVKMHNGKCDRCDETGIIWLDRVGILCWDHYVETTAEYRYGEDRYGKGSS